MDITRDWELSIRRLFNLKDGWISKEALEKVCFGSFKLGIQHLYKWRNFLIEQPNDKDVVVVRGVPGQIYTLCRYAKGKGLININTGKLVNVHSSLRWKLVEANQPVFEGIDTDIAYSEICNSAMKDKQDIEK